MLTSEVLAAGLARHGIQAFVTLVGMGKLGHRVGVGDEP